MSASEDAEDWEWPFGDEQDVFAGLDHEGVQQLSDLGWSLRQRSHPPRARHHDRMDWVGGSIDDPEILSLYNPRNDVDEVVVAYDHTSVEVQR